MKSLEEKLSWNDIGGLASIKNEFKNLIATMVTPEIYVAYGIRPPKGIMLYGCPGSGKTLLVKVAGRESGIDVVSVNCSNIDSKWYGQSAQNMQKYLDDLTKIAKHKGAVIGFIDEIDSLGKNRKSSHEASGKVLSVLLNYLDGIKTQKGVYVVGATNLPDTIDTALTRPGRLDRIIKIGLPNLEDRAEIYKIHIQKIKNSATKDYIAKDINYNKLSIKSNKFSGADIAEVVRKTAEDYMWKTINLDEKTPKRPLGTNHFLFQIENYDWSRGGSRKIKNRLIGFGGGN